MASVMDGMPALEKLQSEGRNGNQVCLERRECLLEPWEYRGRGGEHEIEIATKLGAAVEDACLAADQQRRHLEFAKRRQRALDRVRDQESLRARGSWPTGRRPRPSVRPVTWCTIPFAPRPPGVRSRRARTAVLARRGQAVRSSHQFRVYRL